MDFGKLDRGCESESLLPFHQSFPFLPIALTVVVNPVCGVRHNVVLELLLRCLRIVELADETHASYNTSVTVDGSAEAVVYDME